MTLTFYKKCKNSLTLIEPVLEQYLIDHIVKKLLTPENLNFAFQRFKSDLDARIASERNQRKASQAGMKNLLREQSRLELEIQNIIASMRELGPQKRLKSEFNRIQGRLDLIDSELKKDVVPDLSSVSTEDARQFVLARASDLSGLLLSNRASAQQVIRQFIGPLKISRNPEGHMPTCRIQGGLRICN